MNISGYRSMEKLVYPNTITDKACKTLTYAYHRWYKVNAATILLIVF